MEVSLVVVVAPAEKEVPFKATQRELLGSFISIKHGFAFDGRFFADSGSHIVLTPGNFYEAGGFKAKADEKWFTGPIPPGYVLQRGDLIVAMTEQSEGLLGSAAIVPEDNLFLHNQRLGLVQVKPGATIDKRYLYYLFNSADVRRQIQVTASGTKIRHTSPGRIEAVTATLPSLAEQIRIGEILGSLDDKIELNRRTDQTLEELARATFRAWFVDFLPVKAKIAGATAFPGMDPATFAALPTEMVETEHGELPKGWERKPLDKVADFLNGLAMQKFPPRDGESIPVIKIAEMKRGVTSSSDRAGTYLDERFIVNDGDMLFSWSGTLDVCLWTGGVGALNQHLFKVTSSEFPQWFYYFWVKEHLEQFQATAANKATTMGHIQRGDLSRAMCAVPAPDILAAADRLCAPLPQLVIDNNVESRTLAATRDLLLQRLIGGKQ